MARETLPQKRARTARLIRLLDETYPLAHCELVHTTPFQLLAATILSAQCTDKRVNLVTPELFRRFPTPALLAGAPLEELEDLVRTTGFFRNKAKNLQEMARGLVTLHGGEVPLSLEALVQLPGVGRKTANVVLGEFSVPEGVVVDTHVIRLSGRLGLTTETTAEKIEAVLSALVPRDGWAKFSHLLIWHGRNLCDARRPQCGACPLATECPTAGATTL